MAAAAALPSCDRCSAAPALALPPPRQVEHCWPPGAFSEEELADIAFTAFPVSRRPGGLAL